MKRFAFLVFPLLCFSGPAISADLDGPVYRERETVTERPLPPRIVEKRVIEITITSQCPSMSVGFTRSPGRTTPRGSMTKPTMLVLIAHMRTLAGARDISFLASGTRITVAVGDRPLSTKLGCWLCVQRPFVFERLDRKNDCSRAANVARGAAPRRSCNLAEDFAALATVCDYKSAC